MRWWISLMCFFRCCTTASPCIYSLKVLHFYITITAPFSCSWMYVKMPLSFIITLRSLNIICEQWMFYEGYPLVTVTCSGADQKWKITYWGLFFYYYFFKCPQLHINCKTRYLAHLLEGRMTERKPRSYILQTKNEKGEEVLCFLQ